MNRSNDRWFGFPKKISNPRLRLFCFPYAGGGSMIYRTWANYLPEVVELCCVNLPGRENRIGEACYQSLIPLVEAIAEEITSYLDKPFAFFGHSMGAMLSFELARYLQREKSIEPVELFLSARRAPHLPNTEPPTYNLPMEEFLEEVKRLKGTPEEVFAHPELIQMMEPLLRADFEVCQTYTYTEGPPLTCRIAAFGGLKDEEVPREEIEAWREHTSGSFVLRMIAGDHFFLQTSRHLLLQMISQEILLLMQSGNI